jgi:hypothetical protein
MQQATLNLFADMGVQPATLQPGLVAAFKSTDALPPTASVTAAPTSVVVGSPIVVSGTANDFGGQVGAVELSADGSSWIAATGRAAWTWTYTPTTTGAVTIRARAVDDSGNIGPTATTTVNVTCPCSALPNDPKPDVGLANDYSAVELGMKFRTTRNGFISGVRFY